MQNRVTQFQNIPRHSRKATPFLGLAALVALSLAAVPAHAQTTITFDDIQSPGQGVTIANGYQGLNWNNFYVLDSTTTGGGYAAGTISGQNVAFNGFGNESMSSVTPGSTFILNSGYFTGAWNDNLNLTVTGLNSGLTLFTKTITLSATAPMLVNFNFVGVDQVSFVSSGGTHHDGYNSYGTQFALDNLTINSPTSAAPEPSAVAIWAFVGLGAAGLVLKARKRRETAV